MLKRLATSGFVLAGIKRSLLPQNPEPSGCR
jgi:hypothetical protein